jgi:hypothetical protein
MYIYVHIDTPMHIQELALTAESIVPKTWWRQGFANEQLLLTTNDRELPR